jgi:predicted DCC family thiol-disulfide oxidoreductase YuxK
MARGISDALRHQLQGADLLLIFDGHCGVCTRFADWVQHCDASGRVRLVPSQAHGLLDATGLTRAELDREAWALDRSGRWYAGAAAINRVLRALGGSWRLLALAYAVPGVRWCEDAGYRWFARHRSRLSRWGVTPACERPGGECVGDAGDDS